MGPEKYEMLRERNLEALKLSCHRRMFKFKGINKINYEKYEEEKRWDDRG